MQWLKDSVELPQYERNFRDFRVTGNTLPRSAGSFSASQTPINGPTLPPAGQRRKRITNICLQTRLMCFKTIFATL